MELNKEILIKKYNNEILYLRAEKHSLNLEQIKIMKGKEIGTNPFQFEIEYLKYKNFGIEKDKISMKINILLEKIKYVENPFFKYLQK